MPWYEASARSVHPALSKAAFMSAGCQSFRPGFLVPLIAIPVYLASQGAFGDILTL
jgi:hypothetical protein